MPENAENTFSCPYCGADHPVSTEACPASGEAIPPHYRNVGRVLEGKYALTRVIGEGGMGIVYQAKHMLIGRSLAVKVLFPEIANHPEIVERFYNEARTAAGIGHDHIIEITDMGTFENSPFIVMEYLEGMNLTRFMQGKVLPLEAAVGILMQVLDALNAVHSKGVIHRDLKPDNIYLINKGGRTDFVKLLDFGISKLKTPEAQNFALTRTGTVLGTPYYMAPEQAAGRKEQDHRIDIYAVGVILYEMLTAKLPYQGDNYNALIAAILTEEPLRPTAHNPEIPMEVENIIVTAMAKQPHLRYPNAINFMEALKPFAPNWALRPSKTPGLTSTMSYGQTVAAPTPTPIADSQISYSQPVAQTPSQMGISNTSDLSLAGIQAEKGGGKKLFVILGIAVVVLLMIGGGLAVGFGTGLIGKGEKEAVDDTRVGADLNKPKEEVKPLVEEKPVDTRVLFEILGAPEGAVISLGGEALKGNPAKVEPYEEERELKIEAEGFEPWVENIVINRSMTIRLTSMIKEGDTKAIKKKKKSSDKPVYVVEKEEAPPPKIEVSPAETPKKEGKKKGGKKETSVYGGKETGIDDSIYK